MQDIPQPDKYKTDSDQIMKVPTKVTFEVVYGRNMHDHVGKISTRSWLMRLGLSWLYDLYFNY